MRHRFHLRWRAHWSDRSRGNPSRLTSLVVETRNFKIPYRGSIPARTRLIERFTPVDAQTVEWRVTIDDPSTWTRPWTFAVPLTKDASQPPYAMFNILRGSREIEKARDEAARKP